MPHCSKSCLRYKMHQQHVLTSLAWHYAPSIENLPLPSLISPLISLKARNSSLLPLSTTPTCLNAPLSNAWPVTSIRCLQPLSKLLSHVSLTYPCPASQSKISCSSNGTIPPSLTPRPAPFINCLKHKLHSLQTPLRSSSKRPC